MKKLWLLIASTFFEAGRNLAHAGPRGEPPPRPRQQGIAMPFEGGQHISCIVCSSLPEAEEKANEFLRKNPMTKIIIFESISMLEIVPSNPIVKRWDDNGELGL